jgi:hypothetical protein
LKLAIELSILFCDWTVYFQFLCLSRTFRQFVVDGENGLPQSQNGILF